MVKITNLKQIPVFGEHDFLSRDHYIRYKVVKDLINTPRTVLLAEDGKYKYYLVNIGRMMLVIGTDDSGKWFSVFTNVTMGSGDGEIDTKYFRNEVFGFEYHWWEVETIWKQLKTGFILKVRMQGDLIMGLITIRKHNINTLLGYAPVREFIAGRALERGDTNTYYAVSGVLPQEIVKMLGINITSDVLYDYIKEMLKVRKRYKVIWGKHVFYFKGLQFNHRTFLISSRKVIFEHPEHGRNEFPVKEPVIGWVYNT